MKQKLIAIVASAMLSASLVAGANQADTENQAAAQAPAPAASFNFFDPAYWSSAFAAPAQQPAISGELTFNAATPAGWMQWIAPQTHQQMHTTFVNPASYVQFMRPDFYMEFMKPENMMAWMNPASYQAMMDPQTMNYWMNPATYTHAMNPAMYQQTMNPANYAVYMNPATYASLMQPMVCEGANGQQSQTWFWMGC